MVSHTIQQEKKCPFHACTGLLMPSSWAWQLGERLVSVSMPHAQLSICLQSTLCAE